ncbi:MAG: hypothetical protein HY753_05155 [Nitrospirae bacterium]|nr:hypothetical protein [Nitrospirota bacterium]
MKDKYAQLKKDVLWEQSLIDETLSKLNKIKSVSNGDFREEMQKPAIGTYLMNFYNGIENIIKRISKEYYVSMPKGESWHQELLVLSCNPPEGKIPILNGEILERLHKYRGFRHIFVSGYGFKLDWERMKKLVDDVTPLWEDIKKSIDEFFDKLGRD